jgi:IMP dehydrogenase
VLDLEGLWTRDEDPTKQLEAVAKLPADKVVSGLREIYSAPIKAELIRDRLAEIRASGVTVAGALTPQSTAEFSETVIKAGVDLFVIRGTTVSAEHVSKQQTSLNLKDFIYRLDVPVVVGGAATYKGALHLMRTGAAGVLVGFGGGAASTTRKVLGIHAPMATAIADVAGARRDYMDESGGRYVHVIADGGLGTSGDVVKAIAMGGKGFHWGQEAWHEELPRGARVEVGQKHSIEEILMGPASDAEGTTNLIGALRRAMATTGYSDLKEFQRADVVVAPYSPR